MVNENRKEMYSETKYEKLKETVKKEKCRE